MLEVSNLVKEFETDHGGRIRAVDEVSFTVPRGAAFTLLGASGCGKTTTLRCIAGLERPSRGRITIGGATVFDSDTAQYVPPNRRGLGMVFQSYAIWPHMNVFENVAFPLRIARYGRAEIRDRVTKAIGMVQLDGLERRPATKLSGGQQQRLAVARALVHEPRLLLLDEPLSNLDAKLREQMRLELKALQKQLGLTTIYVTHDQQEAMVLSDVIAVIRDGRIVQMGSPRDIYERPASQFVAGFVGHSNLIPGSVTARRADDRFVIATACGDVVSVSTGPLAVGQTVVVSIRPEHLSLSAAAPPTANGVNLFPVHVNERIFQGEATYYLVGCGAGALRVHTTARLAIEAGQSAFASVPAADCVCMPSDPIETCVIEEDVFLAVVNPVFGRQGMVVSGHVLATHSAWRVLADGGSCVDAALAGAAVLAVVAPQACTIGGDGLVLGHDAASGAFGLNATGRSPAATRPEAFRDGIPAKGPLSVSVPGIVGGWQAMHQRFGRRPWAVLFDDAIAYAEDGFGLSADTARALSLTAADLASNPGASQFSSPTGARLAPATGCGSRRLRAHCGGSRPRALRASMTGRRRPRSGEHSRIWAARCVRPTYMAMSPNG